MLEKWKKSVDMKKYVGALLTDLSKAFDCISHDPLIAKLHAYGFDLNTLNVISSYLKNRFQKVKVNSAFSIWFLILCGVPQGSKLGPLIFNIYLINLFISWSSDDLANYADDNTPSAISYSNEEVISQFEANARILFEWPRNNCLKANPDKSHLILSKRDQSYFAKIDGHEIQNSEHVKLLGITIDSELKSGMHLSKICKKESQKLHALSRICRFMNISQRRVIMKSFFESQFGYCPLVWMFCRRKLNSRINKLHERALVYDDHSSTFQDLLIFDGSFTIHERNIQILAIEIFKVIRNKAPDIMKEVFILKKHPPRLQIYI